MTQVIIYKVFGWNLNVIKVFVRGIIRFARSTFEYRVWVILYFSTCISVCDRTSVLVGLFSIISKTRSRTAVYKIFTYSKIKKSNAFLTIYLYFSLSINNEKETQSCEKNWESEIYSIILEFYPSISIYHGSRFQSTCCSRLFICEPLDNVLHIWSIIYYFHWFLHLVKKNKNKSKSNVMRVKLFFPYFLLTIDKITNYEVIKIYLLWFITSTFFFYFHIHRLYINESAVTCA